MPSPVPLVFVALDQPDHASRRRFAARLAERVEAPGFGFKVNLDAAARPCPDSPGLYGQLEELAELGRPLFLDLKMWNGGRTMAAIAEGLAAHPELGVTLVNAYAHAGEAFLQRVVEALGESPTQLLGLTVLTHYDDATCQQLYGRDLGGAVDFLARRALDGGCAGIILPSTALEKVRDLPGRKLCPGIRPAWMRDKGANAQVQTRTPGEAVRAGATDLVVGTPVAKAEDPAEALRRILWEVQGAAG